MDEYIDRRGLIAALRTFAPEQYTVLLNQLITEYPAADVEEVRHGKFIKRTPYSEPECDQCGKCPKLVFGILPNYCPHCGAKMDEVE